MAVENIGWIGDGMCNGGAYASDECGNDVGDRLSSTADNIGLVGDGKCHTGAYNSKEFSCDGGDYVEVKRKKEKQYKNCNVSSIGWIGDSVVTVIVRFILVIRVYLLTYNVESRFQVYLGILTHCEMKLCFILTVLTWIRIPQKRR